MDSLSAQVSGLTRLAAAHRTWFVEDVFIDVASDKTGLTRLEFNRMINECGHRNLDIIPTISLSYFERNTKEGLEAIRKIRASWKRGIFEKDKIDTETVKDEFLISLIEVCDLAGNDWRSENTHLGLKYRAEDGTSGLYNRVYYGYKKDKNGMLIIDEEEAKVVRYIYDWYLEGYSIGGIIDKLAEKKIKTFPKVKNDGVKERLN